MQRYKPTIETDRKTYIDTINQTQKQIKIRPGT